MLIECRSGSPVRQVSALIPLVRIRGLSADSAGRRPGYRTVDGPDARLNGMRTVPDPAWLAGTAGPWPEASGTWANSSCRPGATGTDQRPAGSRVAPGGRFLNWSRFGHECDPAGDRVLRPRQDAMNLSSRRGTDCSPNRGQPDE